MQTKNTTLDNYNVNFGRNEISMINLKENTVSLIIYDKNKFNTKDYYFSYKLSSDEQINHQINSENYNYEVNGPNGFVRKFKGSKPPKIKVTLSNNISQNEIELKIDAISGQTVTVNLENVYLSDGKDIIINNQEIFTFNLDRTRGWYDLKIKTEYNSWHFAGRIELAKS
ncbi:phospholipase domain-containing protein [Chryseobacterium terrae]|uniref:Phospholipase domain-containing protein n=1 Tax=Chryseobacterium terrae TaxID=3163299 RepID=A0ABW8Y3Q0_9FLAO